MTGETNLARLIAGLRPVLDPETYLFCRAPGPGHPLAARALMTFHEDEGSTLILPAALATPDLDPQFPCRRITLTVHSSLAAVGLMAAVSAALAQAGIGCNPVAAWHHDHLFVAQDQAEATLALLHALAQG
jgi:hypothetical protein